MMKLAMWSLSILLAVSFVLIGASKLQGASAAGWAARFSNWGYPAGSSYVVGVVEILAGAGLLVASSRRLAAVTLIVVMTGALLTHLVHAELARTIPPLMFFSLSFLVSRLDRAIRTVRS